MVYFLLFIVLMNGAVSVMGQCRLHPHPSVEYRCIVPGAEGGTRACESSEPAGTTVIPICRKPNYYTTSPLAFMHCFEGGNWDYVARCLPECGRVTPDGKGLVIGGRTVKRGELPWHAAIYSKTTKPYKQICGGSLVSNNVVLSAAHCFWNDLEKQLPASQFAVAVGKLFRPWDDIMDGAQQSNVKVIHLPRRYQGAGANYQDDIAVVIVAKEFRYKTYIRPVCLSFDYLFETQQLFPGVIGKVAGWGLTSANGNASLTLQVVDLPYVDVGTCIKNSRPDYREFITSDKICAGTLQPDTALCEGDSGGGLVFLESIRGVQRYYLRGLVSTAPTSYNGDKCNNDTYTSFTSILKHEHFIKQFWIEQGEFKCRDGSYISVASYCDGTKDCADGSDETVAACSKNSCSSYLFRCAYGACVDKGATCNGIPDCADGSDETDNQCTTGRRPILPLAERKEGACILPPFPEHGSYESNIAGMKPGQGYEQVILTNVTCQRGYGVLGPISDKIYCFNGFWTEEVPKCVRMCTLDPSPSVEYTCLDFFAEGGNRVCKTYEQNGTLVKPQCRKPDYYSKSILPYMQCLDGEWDNIPKCTPECGRVVPAGMALVAGGKPAYRGELPWFAGIYTKTATPTILLQICGGSLLKNDIVLTAAHCFHKDKTLLPAAMYGVAVGKLYRSWDAEEDGQKSDVKTILVPPRYSGVATNYQDDIALVLVKEPFEYEISVRPVCLNFDVNFERQQLQDGNKGKVAGWGLTHEGGTPAHKLQVAELPYVEVSKCIAGFPPSYLAYTTSDKICAGTLKPGASLCKGDTGGGLVFPAEDRNGIQRYYIRGIVSTSPQTSCNDSTYTSFTQIQKHEDFFKRFMRDI